MNVFFVVAGIYGYPLGSFLEEKFLSQNKERFYGPWYVLLCDSWKSGQVPFTLLPVCLRELSLLFPCQQYSGRNPCEAENTMCPPYFHCICHKKDKEEKLEIFSKRNPEIAVEPWSEQSGEIRHSDFSALSQIAKVNIPWNWFPTWRKGILESCTFLGVLVCWFGYYTHK